MQELTWNTERLMAIVQSPNKYVFRRERKETKAKGSLRKFLSVGGASVRGQPLKDEKAQEWLQWFTG